MGERRKPHAELGLRRDCVHRSGNGPGSADGDPRTLREFDATQTGGTYTKDGVKRAIAQKAVVIPGQDGLFVLQLNADGTADQMGALMDATGVIDEQTTITP